MRSTLELSASSHFLYQFPLLRFTLSRKERQPASCFPLVCMLWLSVPVTNALKHPCFRVPNQLPQFLPVALGIEDLYDATPSSHGLTITTQGRSRTYRRRSRQCLVRNGGYPEVCVHHALGIAIGLADPSLCILLLGPHPFIGLSWLQIPSCFPHAGGRFPSPLSSRETCLSTWPRSPKM